MADIKDRLARLSALAKGPELIWPHMADVADAAVARIEELEAEAERLAATVRFLERKTLTGNKKDGDAS